MTRADTAAAARMIAAGDATRAEELRRIAAQFAAAADRLEELGGEQGEEPGDA